jgi:hypothetical protein
MGMLLRQKRHACFNACARAASKPACIIDAWHAAASKPVCVLHGMLLLRACVHAWLPS